MHKKFWLVAVLLLAIPGLLFTVSCAKKTVRAQPAVKAEDEAAKKAAEEAARRAELERQKRLEEERLRAEKARREAEKGKMEDERVRFESEMIYFDFDKSNLKPEAQEVLKRKAEFLRKYPDVKVIIEGHCDERGTNEYNLALGDRRANSAKAFLVNLGIAESRLTTISYGEERPLDPGHNEKAWAKNRRDQFVIE
ncbi:MAG: peptidoglycan-associated lipoprotein Pal [Deltaproteobacteria bacterium]|nr:peptidoglycan-associated lipoprotein Pal [Deltaproteobacteria bacterium]MBW2150606.1 peptidoglycan-associated lipoprotein Pal [Deltaproteobacteria bacterium]